MANSLFKIKYDGSFSFVPEEKLMNEIKKSHTWFTNTLFGKICTIVFAGIDLCGFYQLATNTINISALNRWVIVSAFLVAFEIAPLYYGYALCLNSYNMGKQIHKYVKKYSIYAFSLGIIGNIIYRALTYNVAINEYGDATLAVTIVMLILPIITSLMSIVIGCLMFDPLLFEMNAVSKKLNRLNIAKRKIESAIVEYNEFVSNDISLYTKNEEEIYNSKLAILEVHRQELYDYINYKTEVHKK